MKQKIQLIHNSDVYWQKLWNKIDKSQHTIFLVTFDMDNKLIANVTLKKIENALERGVKVVIVVEHVNFFLKFSNYQALYNKGAILIKPNPVFRILKNIYQRNFAKTLNRYHQKVTMVDNDLFIGSINCADEYSGEFYGSNKYVDMSLIVKNTPCKGKILNFFKEIIEDNKHQIRQERFEEIEEIINEEMTSLNYFPNSENSDQSLPNSPNDYEFFLEETSPNKTEIQESLYNLLNTAEESITIIQCYYMNLKKVEDLIVAALDRGVKVDIITAKNREQSVYRHINNVHLFERLLKKGANVYEFLDKNFHMKSYMVDNKYLSIGSFNNDITSFVMDNEANYLVVRNKENGKLFNDFNKAKEDIKDNCRQVLLIREVGMMNRFRMLKSRVWHYLLYLMENFVASREIKYNK